jgi:heme/copper-type cytochrome/quinol oxidase subunit 2
MNVPPALLWTVAAVVAAVFAIMIHSIATFRRAGSVEAAAGARDKTALTEVFWAIVPIFIMVASALPAVRLIAADPASSNVAAVQAHADALFTTTAAGYKADRK